jgi:hypothetical protein
MSTTISPPKTTAEQLSEEGVPLLAPKGDYVSVMDITPLQGGRLLAPPSQETRLGRALRPNEALSSAVPLVLVRGAEHGKEMVLPGYYACVGTMPCADTEYYLLVRWEHRERGRQAEKRVVLPEHIRVLDPEALLLPPSLSVSVTAVASSGPASAVSEDLGSLTPESTTSTNGKGQWSRERYPQLQHSSKRKT